MPCVGPKQKLVNVLLEDRENNELYYNRYGVLKRWDGNKLQVYHLDLSNAPSKKERIVGMKYKNRWGEEKTWDGRALTKYRRTECGKKKGHRMSKIVPKSERIKGHLYENLYGELQVWDGKVQRSTCHITRANANLWTKYRLRPQEYIALFKKQDFQCALCDRQCLPYDGVSAVDHKPGTGYVYTYGAKISKSGKRRMKETNSGIKAKVRGILCRGCNLHLGYIETHMDFGERALKYLERTE